MAKGDKKKMENQAKTQTGLQQGTQDRMLNEAIIPNVQENQGFYRDAANRQANDYNDIMNRYRALSEDQSFKNQPGLERVNYDRSPEMNEAFGGYRNFMNTGGFSDQDLQNMRARGVSPIRANYQNMTNEMMRQKNLAGGYSPNMGAVMTKLGSQRGQMAADALENVNARIAEQVQQGKMFGTSGMGNLSATDTGFRQQAALANQQAGLQIAQNRLYDPRFGALQGMAQLYGTTPGQAALFGNQTQQGINNWMNANQQQQGIGNNAMNYQQQVANTPSNFEVGMGRVGQGIQMAGQGAAAWMGVPGLPKPGAGMGQVYTDPNVLRQQMPQAPPRR